MLPHWQRFGSSLCGRTAVERIEFSGISLPVDIILPTFQSMDNLTHLSFNVVKLRDGGSYAYRLFSERTQV